MTHLSPLCRRLRVLVALAMLAFVCTFVAQTAPALAAQPGDTSIQTAYPSASGSYVIYGRISTAGWVKQGIHSGGSTTCGGRVR